MIGKEFIGKLNPLLFWEYDSAKINPEKHKVLILERVFTRGSWEEYKLLFSYYSRDEIREGVVKIMQLDPKTLNFLSVIFEIPKTDFICYGKKQWME